MIGGVESPFAGALAGFAEKLRWVDADSGEPQASSGLRPHLDCFHASVGGPWPAACSLWGQLYFNTLLIPATCLLASDGPRDGGARRLAASFCPGTGAPQRFTIYAERGDRQSAGSTLLRLLDEHIGCVIDELAAQGGLSKRMLWEGVDCTLRWTVAELATGRPDRIPKLERLSQPGSRLTFASAPYRGSARKFCCLRYQLTGHQTCPGVCPHVKTRA